MSASKIDANLYREQGYLVVEDLVPKDIVIALRRYLEDKVEKALEQVFTELGESDSNISSLVSRIGDQGRLEELSASSKSVLSGHFPLEVRLSENLWEIPRSQMFRDMLNVLVGNKALFMHMPPAARFVLPGNIFAGVPAHQDAAYGEHMSDFLTVWVPLVDIDAECGGLALFEGSHYAPVPIRSAGGPFWMGALPTDNYKRIDCHVKAGSAIVMNKLLIHESVGNRSNRCRLSIDYRFFGAGSSSTKHALDLQTWQVLPPSTN